MAILLTRAAWEVLREEAEREIKNSFRERHSFRGTEEGDRHERIILACADVLGVAPKYEDEYEFTDEALWWMRQSLAETRDHLDYLDDNEEGPLEYTAKLAYLVRVLERILDAYPAAVA
jgi:hypothetical protein